MHPATCVSTSTETHTSPLCRAAENGHVDVVDCLLRHAMFDPSADGNRAIWLAAQRGHVAVVERLLKDEPVDPSARDNFAVCSQRPPRRRQTPTAARQARRSVGHATTRPSDSLRRTATSPSSIGCWKTDASTSLSLFNTRIRVSRTLDRDRIRPLGPWSTSSFSALRHRVRFRFVTSSRVPRTTSPACVCRCVPL